MDSITRQAYVFPEPVASFTTNDSDQCQGIPFVFNNTSQISSGTLSMTWMPGDSGVYYSQNLIHTYQSPGNYHVRLIAAVEQLCADTVTHLVTVFPKPSLPLIHGDSLVLKHHVKTYEVAQHTGSTWDWFVWNDSAHHNSIADSIEINWGSGDSGIVFVTETSSLGCVSDTAYLVVYLVPNVGVHEWSLFDHILVYPQPASDRLLLKGDLKQLLSAHITSIEGRKVRDFNQEELWSRELNLSEIGSGVYFIQFQNIKGEVMMKKITIIK